MYEQYAKQNFDLKPTEINHKFIRFPTFPCNLYFMIHISSYKYASILSPQTPWKHEMFSKQCSFPTQITVSYFESNYQIIK